MICFLNYFWNVLKCRCNISKYSIITLVSLVLIHWYQQNIDFEYPEIQATSNIRDRKKIDLPPFRKIRNPFTKNPSVFKGNQIFSENLPTSLSTSICIGQFGSLSRFSQTQGIKYTVRWSGSSVNKKNSPWTFRPDRKSRKKIPSSENSVLALRGVGAPLAGALRGFEFLRNLFLKIGVKRSFCFWWSFSLLQCWFDKRDACVRFFGKGKKLYVFLDFCLKQKFYRFVCKGGVMILGLRVYLNPWIII